MIASIHSSQVQSNALSRGKPKHWIGQDENCQTACRGFYLPLLVICRGYVKHVFVKLFVNCQVLLHSVSETQYTPPESGDSPRRVSSRQGSADSPWKPRK